MTSKFSIDNRELLQRISSGEAVVGIDFGNLIVRELAAFRLAAMDSEPVAYISKSDFDAGYPHILARRDFNKACTMPVYAAQPAPVASADLLHTAASAIEDLLTTKDRTGAGVWFDLPFRLRSAANAQPAPVSPVCTCPSGDGSLRWPCPVRPGNSPVIPEGYVMVPKEPTAEMQSAGASAIRIETTALNKLWTGNTVFRAMLAAAPQPQNAQQNIPEIIPNELIAAVNRLLDSNGSRGCYNAIKCYDAHIEVERLLAAARQEVKP